MLRGGFLFAKTCKIKFVSYTDTRKYDIVIMLLSLSLLDREGLQGDNANTAQRNEVRTQWKNSWVPS